MFTSTFRTLAMAAVLLAAIALAGCTLPAPAVAPAAQQAAQAPATAIPAAPTATAVPPTVTPVPPTATPVPPTATPVPPTATPKPSLPDAKADPMAALLFSSSGKNFESATFTYDMNMSMRPADDASAKALGPAADQLKQVSMAATGQGAMQVVDAAANKANLRMDMEMNAMGQKVQIQMIMIGNTIWTRTGAQAPWQKIEATAANKSSLPGMDPESMMKTFRDATKVEWVEDTQLNGEAMRHLRFDVDPTKSDMSSFLNGMAATSSGNMSTEDMQAMLKNMTMKVDVWLTAKELQLRQEKMVMSLTMPVPKTGGVTVDAKLLTNIDMTMKFDKVNQPVEILPPSPQA